MHTVSPLSSFTHLWNPFFWRNMNLFLASRHWSAAAFWAATWWFDLRAFKYFINRPQFASFTLILLPPLNLISDCLTITVANTAPSGTPSVFIHLLPHSLPTDGEVRGEIPFVVTFHQQPWWLIASTVRNLLLKDVGYTWVAGGVNCDWNGG